MKYILLLLCLGYSFFASSLHAQTPTADYKIFGWLEDNAPTNQLTGNNGQSNLTFSIITPPRYGTLLTNAPYNTATTGRFKYQPYVATNFYTTTNFTEIGDFFTFVVSNGSGLSSQGSVKLYITNVNDAPLAHRQWVRTQTNQPVSIQLTGDDDGDYFYSTTNVQGNWHYSASSHLQKPLTYTIASSPANGTLSGTPPNVTYTPNNNFGGTDQFTFSVTDGALNSAGTVFIKVASFATPETGSTTNWHTNVPFATARIRPGFTNQFFPSNGRNDDGNQTANLNNVSSNRFGQTMSLRLFGTRYTNFFVSNNGLLSFASPVPTVLTNGQVFPFSTNNPLLAPFWGDVDTTPTARGGILTWGINHVKGRRAIGYTWNDVGRYNGKTNALNRFQVVLIDRSDLSPGDFEAEYNYEYVEWLTNDYVATGFPIAGYDAGDGIHFTNFPGTKTANLAQNLTNNSGRFSQIFTVASAPGNPNVSVGPNFDLYTNWFLYLSCVPNCAPTTLELQFGPTTNYTGSQSIPGYLTTTEPGQVNATGAMFQFPLGEILHYRLVASNEFDITSSPDYVFTNRPAPSISGVLVYTNLLNAYINPVGLPTTAWFEWGTTTGYGNVSSNIFVGSGMTNVLAVDTASAGAAPGIYQFRAVATNAVGGIAFGPNKTIVIPYNVNLASLQLTGHTFDQGAFNFQTTNYSLTVNSSVGAVTVLAVPQRTSHVNLDYQLNGGAFTTNAGPLPISLGVNVLNVRVTSSDEFVNKTYRITITRVPSNDATLSGVTINPGTMLSTNGSIHSATVPHEITETEVQAITSYSNATVQINGGLSSTQSATRTVGPLAFGVNTFPINVQSESGASFVSYSLNITRAMNTNGFLSSLSLSDGSLTPAFNPNTSNYSLTVDPSVVKLTVNAVSTNSFATVSMFGIPTNSAQVALNYGGNTIITVQVIAQSGAVRTYTLTVTRPPYPLVATTAPATEIGFSNAILNAAIAHGTGTFANYTFDYGTNGSLTSETGTNLVSGTTNVSLALTGLQAGVTYQYRVRAWSSFETNMGTNVTFATLAAPSIITQPLSVSAKHGSNATFTVVATGGDPLTYQWLFNGTNISGAQATNYTRANLLANDAGNYSVIISNAAGSVTSSNALLTVIPLVPIHFDSVSFITNGQIHLQMSGEPGIYLLQSAPDLTNWSTLTLVTNVNGVFEFIDPETNLPFRFYRTQASP